MFGGWAKMKCHGKLLQQVGTAVFDEGPKSPSDCLVRGFCQMRRHAGLKSWCLDQTWRRSLGWVVSVGLLSTTAFGEAPLQAQENTEHLFGVNIHRFYDGEYPALIDELGDALHDDVLDPRLYYLRGLAYLRSGQADQAAKDLTKGAELEAMQYGRRNYNIGRAFQRVQGNDRMQIEAARADAMKRRDSLVAANAGIPRSKILAELGRSVLDPPAPIGNLPNLPDPTTLSDPSAPFGEGDFERRRPSPPRGAASGNGENIDATTGQDDPFAAPPVRPANSGGDDPFAEPAGQTKPADDPFAQPAKPESVPMIPLVTPEGDDPFAGTPVPTPPARPAASGQPVNGGRVLSKLFGALTSPVRKMTEQGSSLMGELPGTPFGGNDEFPADGFEPGELPPGFEPPPGFPSGG